MKKRLIGVLVVAVFALSIGSASAAAPNKVECEKRPNGSWMCPR